MGRAPCCDKAIVKRGPWSADEDDILRNYLEKHGTGGNWIALPRKAGLKRCGKSCRLRWLNYLRPDIKHGGFTQEEDNIICSLYNNIGSRWSVIAAQLPGRTDNDIKNYWHTKLKKKLRAGKIGPDKNGSNNEITIIDSSTSNVISGPFSASVISFEAEAHANGHLSVNAYGSTTSSSYMTDMKHQQNYDNPGLVLDQLDQFPLPGLMEYSTTSVNNNYRMSSSQEVSSLSSSSSFPLELKDNYAAWYGNGGDEDLGILLDLDFEFEANHHHLFSDASFEEKNVNEVAPCFKLFSPTTSLANSNSYES